MKYLDTAIAMARPLYVETGHIHIQQAEEHVRGTEELRNGCED